MRLESNTIGNVDNPTTEDVYRAFHDDFADVAGNIYAIYCADGTSLHSISGEYLKDFSLSLGGKSGFFRTCTHPLSRDQANEFFTKFLNDDREWISSLNWNEKKKQSWPDLLKRVFRKG